MKTFVVFATFLAVALAQFENVDPEIGSIKRPLPDGRIVGGQQADIADIPYQVSLQRYGGHICGASVIAKRWVLTAAHCLENATPRQITFRAGSSRHNAGGIVVKAAAIYNHPQYDDSTMVYDVALVKTDRDLIGENIKSVAIPEVNDPVVPGHFGIVSGWGYLKEQSYVIPPYLQYVAVPIVAQQTCHKALILYGGVRDMMFCAGTEKHDSCQGDSGGPMVVGGTQLGVVSWGIGCAHPKYPGVYARLAHPHIRQWIKNISGV